MYENHKENQSVRIFVGPFTAGDPTLFSAWFLSSDLGMPRVLPAFAVAGGMLMDGLRGMLKNLASRMAQPSQQQSDRTVFESVAGRQDTEEVPATDRRDEAA